MTGKISVDDFNSGEIASQPETLGTDIDRDSYIPPEAIRASEEGRRRPATGSGASLPATEDVYSEDKVSPTEPPGWIAGGIPPKAGPIGFPASRGRAWRWGVGVALTALLLLRPRKAQ